MAIALNWTDFVGSKTISDGGYVGDLLTIASAHIDNAVITNRLTTQQAGEIYTAMIPSAFQTALKFGMEENLVEAQIADVEAGIALKVEQLTNERNRLAAELEKQWGYSVTRDIDGAIIMGASTGSGKIDIEKIILDEQVETANKQQLILALEEEAKQYEVGTLLPDQHSVNIKQQTLLDSQYDKSEHEIDLLAQKKIGRNQ